MDSNGILKMQITIFKRFVTFNQDGRPTSFPRDDLNFDISKDAVEITEELYAAHFNNTKPECQLTQDAKTKQPRLMTEDEIKQRADAQEKYYLATLTPSELKARELQQVDPKGWALAQREQAAAKSVEMYNAQQLLDKVKK